MNMKKNNILINFKKIKPNEMGLYLYSRKGHVKESRQKTEIMRGDT
jgi:hypothetical protein